MKYIPSWHYSSHSSSKTKPSAHQMPPTPASSQISADDWQYDRQYDRQYNMANNESGSVSQQQPWSHDAPHGLGLTVSAAEVQLRSAAPSRHSHPATTSTFTQPFSTQTIYEPNLHGLRKDPWMDACDPFSTLASSAPWDLPARNFFSSATEEQNFRHLSEYSASTHQSCQSSPYAHSEGYVPSDTSPFIKTEETPDWVRERNEMFSNPALADDSPSVTPADLLTKTGMSQSFRSTETLLLPGPVQDAPYLKAEKCVSEQPSTGKTSSSDNVPFHERQKRGYTQPENANCACERCGRLFQRSYNLKAHMETHDPNRTFPHECQYEDCEKRFKRKTDLLRHEQSVGDQLYKL